MQNPKSFLFSRLFLVTGLLAGLLFSSPAAALGSARKNDNPGKTARASLQPAALAANLLTIPAVPVGAGSPKADGACTKTEYTSGLFVDFPDGPGGTGAGSVYLVHDANYLYTCITSPMGTDKARFDSLYVDPQGDGTTYTFAQQDDLSLRFDFADPTNQTTFRGTGVGNGWQDSSAADNSLWSGAATTGNFDVAEYTLPLANFKINICSTIFGLAGYHHWFAVTGDDYGWPSNHYFDQPGTWQPLVLGSPTCGQAGSIAYVFRSNTGDATSFYSLLTAAGYTVTLVPLSNVTTTDFNQFDLTIIADDTGSLDQWGTPPAATGAAQVAQIIFPNKPILGLGEGGYAFFGRLSLFIGWPQGWHGPQNILTRAAGAPAAIFNGVSPDPVQHYTAPTNSVGIYTKPSYPSDVSPAAMEEPPDDHSSLIQQGCKMLWGNSGNPTGMTSPDGTLLFLNTVGYMRSFQCPKVPPPPSDCGYTIEKTALPAPGSPVTPGTIITYTITYTMVSTQSCPITDGKLVDQVPFGTVFVPGSASDGISPGADGLLTWLVSTSDSPPLTKIFKVQVMDTACTGNKILSNVAELRPSAATPLTTIPATIHPASCPPIGLPNTQPMFAEDELKVDPYPLVAGAPTRLSVRVQNLTSGSLPVTVQFQVAPVATPLGTGLAYTTVATTSATLPGSGLAVLTANYLPDAPGNRCFQALVSTPDMPDPLVTQSCLDLTEDFQPGHLEQPVFVVRNNTSSPQTYTLVVDNTCPGWTASIDPTVTGSLAAGASQNVTLSVTPPNPLTLGSGCHIDVQAWSAGKLVGGVRKLDLPPVHLPTNINPPWEEPEITFNPDPPVGGVPGQVCIQLQNPLSTPKVVTVNFSVADFGAGIGFTPATSLVDLTVLPGLHTFCAPWTPATGGTLHRCVLATLVQRGALDQHSQNNIDIVRPATSDLGGLVIPFMAGNPGLAERQLGFDINLVGINPLWVPIILTPGGDPPPASLKAGGQVALVLRFNLALAGFSPQNSLAQFRLAAAPLFPPEYTYGSHSSVEVTLLLDGSPESGFSISLEPIRLFLPLVLK